MFDTPLDARRRPMFGVSVALHAALAFALAVPPLLATQEPPEPEVRVPPVVPLVDVRLGDAPAREREKKDLLRKGSEGPPKARSERATGAAAVLPPLVQPTDIGRTLPEPTGGDEGPFTIEETGERSEPGDGLDLREGRHGSPDGTCDDCDEPLSPSAPGVTPPVPLETISPIYPESARRAARRRPPPRRRHVRAQEPVT